MANYAADDSSTEEGGDLLSQLASAADEPAPQTPQNTDTKPAQQTPEEPKGAAQPGAAQPQSVSPPPAASQAATPTTPTPASVLRQVASELGYNLPENFDEQATARQLFQSYDYAQRARQQLGQVTPYWSEFQQFLQDREARKQQQAAMPQQPAKEVPWWQANNFFTPVEYDPTWANMVVRNEITGQLEPAPGAPPDIVHRIANYEQHRKSTLNKMLENPMAYMEKPVEFLAERIAERKFQELMAKREEQEFINRTISSPEMDFLWARTPDGKDYQRDFNGHRVVGPWGQRYQQAVAELAEAGIPVHLQQKYAMAQVRSEFAVTPEYQQQLLQQQQQQNQQPNHPNQQVVAGRVGPQGALDQANENFHRKHERQPNMAAVLPGPADGYAPPPTNPADAPQNLVRDLWKTLEAFTDEDVKRHLEAGPGRRTA